MSVDVECPHCDKEYTLEDSFVGRKVRCAKCKEQFLVEAPQDNQSPPSLENFQPAKNDNPGFEILEDADEEETEAYTASDHDFVDSTSDFQETSPQTPPAKNMSLAFLADFAFDRMKIT